jgi:hypothetical protein
MKMLLISLIAADVVGTVALIVVARRNPVIRRRLVQGFRVLVGDMYLAAHEIPSSSEETDADAPEYEEDDFMDENQEELH